MVNYGVRLQVAIEVEKGIEATSGHGDGGLPFAGEEVANLPGKEDIEVQAHVDGQTADENTAGEHGENVDACGDDGHIDAKVDEGIAAFLQNSAVDEGQNGGDGIDQHAQEVGAVVATGLPVGDHIFVLGVFHEGVQKVCEFAYEQNRHQNAQQNQIGLFVPCFALYQENDGEHE